MGSIAKSYGVKGWMKIYSYTNPRCNIIDYSRLWILEIKGKNIYFKVKRIRLVNRFIIVQLYGIKTREKAKKIIGSLIKLPKNILPKLPLGEYYWYQIAKLRVLNKEKKYIGKVNYIFVTGNNDVLVVKNKESKEYFLPTSVINNVNIKKGRITVADKGIIRRH
ncbi:Ribosome maturation factor RimM [Candidatus Portiera aleyrodidarum]|uniref:Ribosome maturation factor RimM n=2 Tax=Candidatus Portiera aleyrodidarum TaxID=91844 RepID=A0A8D3X7A0_9GAMM|nr:16S rRNA processing protein RimM [Candidatus Portiera aleyrodidarum TV]CEI59053.1 Ribosome maturation factor RimM [Candidatus Portiera aleyrodidarum]